MTLILMAAGSAAWALGWLARDAVRPLARVLRRGRSTIAEQRARRVAA